MSGPYGGLTGNYKQAKQAAWVDRFATADQSVPSCADPNLVAIARTMAEAIRAARPVVSLPPNVFIPWRGKPWMREARFILDGSNDATVALGAAAAASAEGLTAVTETTSFTTVGGANPGSFTVPNGMIAVVRAWGAQCDLGGYFPDTNTGIPVVKFVLDFSGDRTLFPIGLQGVMGTVDNPFDVSYIAMPNTVVGVLAFSSDTACWHLIETSLAGHLIPSTDIDDTLNALLENDRQ